MTKKFREKINDVINDEGLCMFENRNGNVYLLWKHYTHVDWRHRSKRVLIAKGELPKNIGYSSDGIYFYLTNTI